MSSPNRGFALLSFLPYIIGGLAVAGAVWSVWSAANSWCNGVCRAQTVRADAAEEQMAAARERATALALLWSEAIQKVEVRHVEVVKWRTQKFVEYRDRPYQASGTITLAPDAVGLLSDSANTANDPGPATGHPPAPSPVPDATGSAETSAHEWISFAVDAAEAYADARGKWLACVAWADAIKVGQ